MAQALIYYAEQHVPSVKDPARIGYAIEALLPFWGELPLSAIRRETCNAYARQRRKVVRRDPETKQVLETAPIAAGTVRKEPGTLQAAINLCAEEGRLINPPKVPLPEKPAAQDRWLSRNEAARLLRAAWRNPGSKHLARFILVALYTGTRKTRILRLLFMPHISGGHVDIERGKLYRLAPGEVETKKRQPHIRMPRKLWAHMRRWQTNQARWVIEHNGQGVGEIKTAWATALKGAGLEGSGVKPHTLRHTAITWAMQNGADIYEASGYFGVSVQTMMEVYAHHHPDYQQGTLDAIDRGGRKL